MQANTQRESSPTGKEAPTTLLRSEPQPQKVRKKFWFKPDSKNSSNHPIRHSMKRKRHSNTKKKKIDYRDVRQKHWLQRKLKKSTLDRQPATPHNTTQFIVNTVHFPTDPYVYDFDSERFPEDKFNHSMLGSMRNVLHVNQEQPNKTQESNQEVRDPCSNSNYLENSKEECKFENNTAEAKGFKSYFPENAYDLLKGRSDSDINSICDYRSDRQVGSMTQTPGGQPNNIDIKFLIEGVKSGQQDLESIIKSLVNKIKEKDDIITNLKGK